MSLKEREKKRIERPSLPEVGLKKRQRRVI